MRSAIVLLSFGLLMGCGASGPPPAPPVPLTVPPPAETGGDTAKAESGFDDEDDAEAQAPTSKTAASAGLSSRIVEAASSFKGVHKAKLRVDKTGKITKQALYHNDPSKVPAAIRKLTEEKFPGAKVVEYELEHYSDVGWVHEVEVKAKDGRECEVSAKEDGTLHYVECKIRTGDMPKPVAAAVKKRLPKGKVVEAETKKGPTIDFVHVKVKVGQTVHYLQCRPTGEIANHWLRIPAAIDVPAR